METVALTNGDLSWVFPKSAVLELTTPALNRCSEQLISIASTLRNGRAGWEGEGLEFHLLPSGKASLAGFAENSEVTFGSELTPPGYYDGGVGWRVEASIAVRCDHPRDCGMHVIEKRETTGLDTPAEAVEALEVAIAWLLRRNSEVPPDEWRHRDPDRRGGSSSF